VFFVQCVLLCIFYARLELMEGSSCDDDGSTQFFLLLIIFYSFFKHFLCLVSSAIFIQITGLRFFLGCVGGMRVVVGDCVNRNRVVCFVG